MNIEFLTPWEKDDIRKKIKDLKQKLSNDKTNSSLMSQISEYCFRIGEYKTGLKYLDKCKMQENIDFPEFQENRKLLNEKILLKRIEFKKTQR